MQVRSKSGAMASNRTAAIVELFERLADYEKTEPEARSRRAPSVKVDFQLKTNTFVMEDAKQIKVNQSKSIIDFRSEDINAVGCLALPFNPLPNVDTNGKPAMLLGGRPATSDGDYSFAEPSSQWESAASSKTEVMQPDVDEMHFEAEHLVPSNISSALHKARMTIDAIIADVLVPQQQNANAFVAIDHSNCAGCKQLGKKLLEITETLSKAVELVEKVGDDIEQLSCA